ncbi:MAG: virulence factor [Planctomycetes bacterium]|nr:virulence factor [Planctomycetota bacterium]
MAAVQILSWKNIPTQVKASDAGGEHNVPLDDRFQQAVDALAMEQELAGTDEYLEHWTWSDPVEKPGSAQEAAEAHAQELDTAWPKPVPAMVKKALSE